MQYHELVSSTFVFQLKKKEKKKKEDCGEERIVNSNEPYLEEIPEDLKKKTWAKEH